MSNPPENVRVTWQLISQFVSWDFCRFMSEHNEMITPESDVLTFLRNMIVQRTEKSISEVTKHEIIAKFIMEIRAIKNFQITGVIPLSESVKKFCPELQPSVDTLIHHLETFFDVLESTDEDRKELIQLRIEEAINNFSKEASNLLPPPELLLVINSWSAHTHQKPVKRAVHNAALLEKILECIHYEGITSSEAKVVAVALAEDKVFQKILQIGEAEPETEADSEQFTLSQSSMQNENAVYSQEFAKCALNYKADENFLERDPPIPSVHPRTSAYQSSSVHPSTSVRPTTSVYPSTSVHPTTSVYPSTSAYQSTSVHPSTTVYKTTSVHPSTSVHPNKSVHPNSSVPPNASLHSNASVRSNSPLEEMPDNMSFTCCVPESEEIEEPAHNIHVEPRVSRSSSVTSPFIHRFSVERNPKQSNIEKNYNNSDNHLQFAMSSANESDIDDSRLHDRLHNKFQQIYTSRMNNRDSDSDTSDCEKNPEFRFLTPTYFKKGANHKLPPVYISDNESNDSSIITNIVSSQQTDPSWSSGRPLLPAMGGQMRPARKKTVAPQKKTVAPQKKTVAPQKKTVAPQKKIVAPQKKTLRRPLSSSSSEDEPFIPQRSPQPHTSSRYPDEELERPAKRGRMAKQLFRSPGLTMDSFISVVRQPHIGRDVSPPPVHVGTNTRSRMPEEGRISSTKRQKCKKCPKSFKTAIGLRRHVFIKHTKPLNDSLASDNDLDQR